MSSRVAADPRPPESHTVASFDGASIRYDLYDAASSATILVVPGFWRDRHHESMLKLGAWLQSLGYRTAVVDVRGHGESEGVYGFNLHEHHDVCAVALDLLRGREGSSLTLLGMSYGGAIAIATAARHQLPINGLVLISSVASAAMIRPQINPLTIHRHLAFRLAFRRPRAAWRKRREARTQALDEIGAVRVPVCFIHVKDDWLVNHRHSVALFENASEPKELHVLDVPGQYHADRIFSVAGPQVEQIIIAFLARSAPPDTSADV